MDKDCVTRHLMTIGHLVAWALGPIGHSIAGQSVAMHSVAPPLLGKYTLKTNILNKLFIISSQRYRSELSMDDFGNFHYELKLSVKNFPSI
jgi:hypothetical protein